MNETEQLQKEFALKLLDVISTDERFDDFNIVYGGTCVMLATVIRCMLEATPGGPTEESIQNALNKLCQQLADTLLVIMNVEVTPPAEASANS